MSYSDLENRSRSTIHILKLCLVVENLHVKLEDPSFIINSYLVYCDIRSITNSDLESSSRSMIHTKKLWHWVGENHAKHEDPSFIRTRDIVIYNVKSGQ
jgi:hypothetical protein